MTQRTTYDAYLVPNQPYHTYYRYDAAGRLYFVDSPNGVTSNDTEHFFDGDGQKVKFSNSGDVTFYLHSTVLGGAVIRTFDSSGNARTEFIVSNGLSIAKKENNQTKWLQADTVGSSSVETDTSGNVTNRVELDPLGNLGQSFDPQFPNPNYSPTGYYGYDQLMNDVRTMGSCGFAGAGGGHVDAPCSMVNAALRTGVGVQCPDGGCGPVPTVDNKGNRGWAFFRYTDSFVGWMTDSEFFGVKKAKKPPVLRSPSPGNPGSNSQGQSAGSPSTKSSPRRGGPNTIFDEETGSISYTGLREYSFQNRYQQLFAEAVVEVRRILQDPNSSCNKFFGVFGLKAFNEMISGVTFERLSNQRIGIEQKISYPGYGRERPIVGTLGDENYYWYFAPNKFTINTDGPFVRNDGVRLKNYDSGSLQSRVLQLLHELGHITIVDYSTRGLDKEIRKRGLVRAETLLREDGPDSGNSSDDNTDEVHRHCKSEIDALGR